MSIWEKKPHLVETLKSMLSEGKCAREIALVLGNGISRSAILGKADRLRKANGEVAKPRPARTFTLPNTGASRNKTRTPPKPVVSEEVLEAMRIDGALITLETLEPHRMCRWPNGDPTDDGFHFCAHEPKSGSPYCLHHSMRAFVPKTGKPSGNYTPSRADRTFK